jgi:hypothetical protein
MKRVALKVCVVGVLGAGLGFAGNAHADEPSRVAARFATPPPSAENQPVVTDNPDDRPRDYYIPPQHAPLAIQYRAPVRFELGPSFVTSGQSVGYGLSGGVSVGTGTVGGKFSATFLRGEGGDNNAKNAPTGESMAQYLLELVLDLKKNGPIHPVVAMGMGLVHVDKGSPSGEAGVGTARVGAEYAFGVDDADVRVGASLLGALVGPASDEVKDLKAYGIFDVHVAVGF